MKLSTITFPMTMTQPAHIIATLANASRGPLSASGSSSAKWAGDKCAEDAANAEAGHDEAGRCRGQPDSTDQEDDEEGVDTGECQVGER